MTLLLDQQMRDEVVEYLADRPYREVYTLISRLSALQALPDASALEPKPQDKP